MSLRLTAIIQPGEQFLVATCPEIPEAHGQGRTRAEALRDLADSIQSLVEYRREEARSQLRPPAEETLLEVA